MPIVILLACCALGDGPARTPWPFAPQDRAHPVSNLYSAPMRLEAVRGYIHGGIDIRKPARTPVLAVTRGTVWIYREGAFDNLVLTESNGDSWEYRHLAADRIPPPVLRAMEEGTPVEVGAVLGEVGPWGVGYTHLHFNRRRADGAILDPLRELHPIPDTQPPVVGEIGLFPAQGMFPSIAPAGDAITIAGQVEIAAVIDDAIDGETTFRHCPQRAEALLISTDGTERRVARWSHFTGALPRPAALPVPRYPRGAGLAAYRRFGPFAVVNPIPLRQPQRFVLAFDAGSETRSWNTTALTDGLYTLRVVAHDLAGNTGSREISLRIDNADPPPPLRMPPRPSSLARELSRQGFTTGFRGDIVEHTFLLPAEWEECEVVPPPAGSVVAPGIRDEKWVVTVRIDTAAQRELRRAYEFRVRAAGISIARLRVTVEAPPFLEVAPPAGRILSDPRGEYLHLRLRTPGILDSVETRWILGEREERLALRRDETVDPHCRILEIELERAKTRDGTIVIAARGLGRTREIAVPLAPLPTER